MPPLPVDVCIYQDELAKITVREEVTLKTPFIKIKDNNNIVEYIGKCKKSPCDIAF